MRCSFLSLGLITLLGTLCVAEEIGVRPVPPGYAYPVLPARYEGKRLSDLGPIKSIELIDRNIPGTEKPSPVTNETVRAFVFEYRLAHPSSSSMLEANYSKTIVVTFEDGTRFHGSHSTLQSITHPDKTVVGCMLLPEENYKTGRMALAVKPDGDKSAGATPAARSDKGSKGKSKAESEKQSR